MEQEKIIDGQLYWHYSRLTNWEKNNDTRLITTVNWDKLVADIKRVGIREKFKVGQDGITYDGNHRYKALQYWINQGITEAENGKSLEYIPLEIVNPLTEAQKWEIALTRNEEFAQWNKETLSNYMGEFENELDLDLINIDFSDPVSISEQLDLDEEASVPGVKKPKEVTCPQCQHQFVI